MESTLIDLTGIICPPEADGEFSRWHDGTYIPAEMQSGLLNEVTRYRLVRSYDEAKAKEYPTCLTVCSFTDLPAFAAWKASPEHAAAETDFRKWAHRGIRTLWRAKYQLIKSWGNTPPLSVITVVGTSCPTENETRFDTWYSQRHVPDLLKFQGMAGAVRYRLAGPDSYAHETPAETKTGEYPRFLTFYRFKDIPTATAYDTSTERRACREDWLTTAAQTKTSLPWRAQYQAVLTWPA